MIGVAIALAIVLVADSMPAVRDSVVGGVRFTQVDTALVTGDSATLRVRFSTVEQWSASLDRPARAAWQKPIMVVDSLGLFAGATVADLGAGTGYFDSLLARAVGPSGKVYAQEIESTLVAHLGDRARRWKLPQIVPVLGTPSDPRLPSNLDLIFVCDVYRYIDDRRAYFRRLRTNLAPGGRLVVIELDPLGAETRVGAERIARELSDAGYVRARRFRFLPKQSFQTFRVREE